VNVPLLVLVCNTSTYKLLPNVAFNLTDRPRKIQHKDNIYNLTLSFYGFWGSIYDLIDQHLVNLLTFVIFTTLHDTESVWRC